MSTTKTTKALAATAAALSLLISAPAAEAFDLSDLFGFSSDNDYKATTSTVSLNSEPQPDLSQFKPEDPMAQDAVSHQAQNSDVDLLVDDPAPVITSGVNTGKRPATPVDKTTNGPWRTAQYAAVSRDIAKIINQHRVAVGEPAMRLDPLMSDAAESWALEMARMHYFQHDPGNRKHGEIIAMRYNIDAPDTAAQFVQQWENSPHHKELMHRSSFHAMGVGVAHDKTSGEVYAVVRLYYR